MKINLFPQINFRSNYAINTPEDFDDGILGFDEQNKVRGALRDDLYARLLGYLPHEKNNNLEAAQTLDDVYITNYKNIGNNSRCGASLARYLNYVHLLKNTGIDKVIDLAEYKTLENECRINEIDYYKYPVRFNYLQHPIFIDDKTLLKKKAMELAQEGITKKQLNIELKQYQDFFKKQRKIFVMEFSDLIKEMNDGHFYIGCELGAGRTPLILSLNTLFNSNWSGEKILPKDRRKDQAIRNMLNNLDCFDKKMLNFTDEQQEFVEKYLNGNSD